jgi:hypothetical protein
MGWSPWGAGCVNGARPVLGGGEAQSIKSKLYAKLERESPLYSPVLSGFMYSVGNRLMRHFQTETGVNYFVVNILICLACTLPAEVVLGLIWRAITKKRRAG